MHNEGTYRAAEKVQQLLGRGPGKTVIALASYPDPYSAMDDAKLDDALAASARQRHLQGSSAYSQRAVPHQLNPAATGGIPRKIVVFYAGYIRGQRRWLPYGRASH